MKPCSAVLTVTGLILLFTACARDSQIVEAQGGGPSGGQGGAEWGDGLTDQQSDDPFERGLGAVGTPEAFDLMTWNLKEFPLKGAKTKQKVAEVLSVVQPDIVAVQEVADGHALVELAKSMPGWEADVTSFYEPGGYYNPPVGMLWNSATVTVRDRQVLMEEDTVAFPRPPLLLEITWKGIDLVVISVHPKALGDNKIDYNDPLDEEMRRLQACNRLEEYISTNYPNDMVVVAGDFNDRIEEPTTTNVFTAFLSKPDKYLFADMPIAQRKESVPSYPSYNSHIDHILITWKLFPSYEDPESFTRTIAVDKYFMNSLSEYYKNVSDHRPVMMHLVF